MNPDQLKQALERLTPDQRAKLEQRLRRNPSATTPSIPRRPDPDEHPLSPGQERLWTLSRLRPGDPVYNIDAVWRIRGPLDGAALESALRTVVGRHEPLRSRIFTESGRPVQALWPASDFTLAHLDLSAEDTDDELLEKEIGRLVSEPFDLAADFLFRATAIHIEEEDHILVVAAHHIVCDGWSIGVLASELGPAYAAAREGTEPHLPELAVSFADVAHWQRTGGVRSSDLEYWAGRLTEEVEPLRLPRARDNRHHGREGATHTFEIGTDLTQRVTALARDLRITSFAVLLAAYQATLNRITGQESIILCTPLAGRSRLEMEPLIGYFNNLMPLAADLRGDPTLTEAMQQAATTVTEAFDHSTPAFQEVAALEAVADKPLSRGLFVLQDGELPAPGLPGLDVESIGHDSESSDFDLAVFLRPGSGSLRGVAAFRPGLFTPAAVASVMTDFVSLLDEIATDPDIHLTDLPDLGASTALPSDSPAGSGPGGPVSLVEARLRPLWERAFRRPVGIDDDFFDLGGHSLLAAELIAAIEEEFSLDPIPLSSLFEAPTVARFSRLLETNTHDGGWQSLVPIKPGGDRPPLFFVHAHGGNVIGYSDLGRHLSPRQPLYGVQSPRGELGTRRIEDMAESYIAEIRTVQPAGPYLVGGWCLGGDVAFEIGRQLRRAGEEVPLVLMVDNPRPEYIQGEAGSGLRHGWNRMATRLAMERANLLEAPRTGAYLVERTSRLVRRAMVAVERLATDGDGNLPFAFEHSQAFRQDQIAAEHDKAYEAYLPEPHDGPVAVFRAQLQPHGRVEDPALGWKPYVTGPILQYELPGHRLGMLSEPRIGRSARIIEAAIGRALGEDEDRE